MMRAADVMTTEVITVTPETAVTDIARLLLRHRISAVPVVERGGRLVGIVSEGDLMRRVEAGTERRRPWWLALVAGAEDAAREYAKTHGHRASDVMTHQVVSVTEDTSLAEIARLLEERHIKRVPVLRDEQVIGIVSRADLLRAVASQPGPPPAVAMDDRTIREQIWRAFQGAGLEASAHLNVIVTDGVVHLWGLVASDDERRALRIAAEGVPGVRGVEDHLGLLRPWLGSV
jgi:CBS domain-containing protein